MGCPDTKHQVPLGARRRTAALPTAGPGWGAGLPPAAAFNGWNPILEIGRRSLARAAADPPQALRGQAGWRIEAEDRCFSAATLAPVAAGRAGPTLTVCATHLRRHPPRRSNRRRRLHPTRRHHCRRCSSLGRAQHGG